MTTYRFDKPVTALLALVLMLAAAQPARAGDYVVHSCKEEVGTPVYPVDGWQPIGAVNHETIGESCFRGGSLWARLPGTSHKVGTYAGWRFDAPPGTEIVNYRISRSTTANRPSSGGGASPSFYVAWPANVRADLREVCFQPTCSALGRRDRAVPQNIIVPPVPMAGVRSLFFAALCGGTTGYTCLDADSPPGTDAVRFDIHAAKLTLRDSAPPAIAAVSGPLAEPGRTHRGTTTVNARATDAGAGVASFALEVAGRTLTTAAAPGCQAQPFTRPAPCPADVTQTLELDTNALPYGLHPARIVAHDASGNPTASGAFEVRVDNRRLAAYAAALRFDYAIRRGGTRFTRLSVRGVPRGAAITLTCAGRKHRCPFTRKRAVRAATRSSYTLLPALKKRLLRPGARLEVRIAAGDQSVRRLRFTIRRGAVPKRSARCRAGDAGARYRSCP